MLKYFISVLLLLAGCHADYVGFKMDTDTNVDFDEVDAAVESEPDIIIDACSDEGEYQGLTCLGWDGSAKLLVYNFWILCETYYGWVTINGPNSYNVKLTDPIPDDDVICACPTSFVIEIIPDPTVSIIYIEVHERNRSIDAIFDNIGEEQIECWDNGIPDELE